MKSVRTVLLIVIALIILTAAGFFVVGYTSPKPAGIKVLTNPKASVFINGSLVGETPYEGSFKAEKIVLRLVPEGSSESLIPYETTINLVSGIETVVGRDFEISEDSSLVYIISFEKADKGLSGLSVISQPNNAQVLIDGVSRGFSPYSSSSVAPAVHVVSVKSPGFDDFSENIKTVLGYKLLLYVKLGKTAPLSEEKNDANEVKIVKILDTPTGYLRVRNEPGGGGEEIAQVEPGDEFSYLDTDIATGWIEIQYQASKSGLPAGITGWVSDKYATVSSVTQ